MSTINDNTDINALALADEEILDYDTERDINDRPVIPEGEYDVRFQLGSNGVTGPKTDRNGKAFYTVDVQATVIAPGSQWDGYNLRDFPTTILLGGTSKVADFLNKIGTPLRRGMRLSEVPEFAIQALAAEPTGRVFVQWVGEYKEEGAQYGTPVKGMRGMRFFPQNEDGTYKTKAQHPEYGEVTARAQIARYLPAQGQAQAA